MEICFCADGDKCNAANAAGPGPIWALLFNTVAVFLLGLAF
jgi:hypothetical protein